MGLIARPAMVLIICCLLSAPSVAAPRVVASIKPIHALVSAVMAGVGEPRLLMSATGSPHTFQLKPSGARLLEAADVIFWMGPALESFLAKALTILPRNARVARLYDAPGVDLLTEPDGQSGHTRENNSEVNGDALNREHAEIDMHAWLDPQNARAMAAHIAATLIAVDPSHQQLYRANADTLDARLATLDRTLSERFGSITKQPYVVFHDAYRYFEERYGLEHLAAVAPNPHRRPGADRLSKIRAQIKTLQEICVFIEPQFRSALITPLTEGTNAKIEMLDPLGANLEPGPDLYFELLEGLADGFVRCLTASS